MLGGIQHHLNNAFHVTICGCQATDLDSEAARNGRAYLIPVEFLPLNLARFEHVLGQDVQYGFGLKLEPESLHAANQAPLAIARFNQKLRNARDIPLE